MARKDVQVPIYGSCDYVTIHGKEDFADVIKIRILSRGERSS